jgi:L-aspartate oxidase
VRSGQGLRQASEQLEALTPQLPEERSIHQVALLIARCALAREESRGAHFRTDYPESREVFAKHSIIRKGSDVTFR